MCFCERIIAVMTRREWKILAARHLRETDAPVLTASLLLCHVLGLDRTVLIAHDEEELSAAEREQLEALLLRRAGGEPLAYILGVREFYGRDFAVDRHTLIPRPETEDMVEEALRFSFGREDIRFADLGTGSGCIAVTLAAERMRWQGVAVDISKGALKMARRNAEACGVTSRLSFLQADFTGVLPLEEKSFQLVVSNPPYVSEEEYAGLDPGVRDFEPRHALVPGPSGMEHPCAVEEAARRLLEPGGLFLMEHGWLQGEACRALCSPAFWTRVETMQDLAGRDRFLLAVRS